MKDKLKEYQKEADERDLLLSDIIEEKEGIQFNDDLLEQHYESKMNKGV